MRRFAAPVFVVAVLGFVAFSGLVMTGVGPNAQSARSTLTLPGWQVLAFAGWLLICAALVIGGTLAERRAARRRRG